MSISNPRSIIVSLEQRLTSTALTQEWKLVSWVLQKIKKITQPFFVLELYLLQQHLQKKKK